MRKLLSLRSDPVPFFALAQSKSLSGQLTTLLPKIRIAPLSFAWKRTVNGVSTSAAARGVVKASIPASRPTTNAALATLRRPLAGRAGMDRPPSIASCRTDGSVRRRYLRWTATVRGEPVPPSLDYDEDGIDQSPTDPSSAS